MITFEHLENTIQQYAHMDQLVIDYLLMNQHSTSSPMAPSF